MGLAVVARIYPHDHARTPSHREIIVHASLSEDEGVVSNRFGPGRTTRFTKAARREYRFQASRRLGSLRSLSDNNMPAEMAWRFFAIQDVTRSGLAAGRLVRPCWRDRRAAEIVLRLPANLTSDPVERVVVVMKDGAAREAPLAAVLFDQLARVAAGRKATVVAVF